MSRPGRSAAIPAVFPRKRSRPSGPLDGFGNLDPRARFVENRHVAVMTRHYFIVARDQTSLCEYLTRQFKSEENVAAFLDRRTGHDRGVADGAGDAAARRRGAARRQTFRDTLLRYLGY